MELLDVIREDPRQAEVLIKGASYLRCEIQLAKRHEMIVKLDDFLRRRSKIALIMRQEDIKNAPGLMDACEILFEDQAQGRFDEYFQRPATAQRSSENLLSWRHSVPPVCRDASVRRQRCAPQHGCRGSN